MIDATVFAGPPSSIDIESGTMLGVTFESNGLKMVWRGDFALVPNASGSGIDNVASGTVKDVYIYDTTNAEALVGYANMISMDFLDIKSFMENLPGAPVYNVGGPTFPVFNIGGSGDPASTNHVPGVDYAAHNDHTKDDEHCPFDSDEKELEKIETLAEFFYQCASVDLNPHAFDVRLENVTNSSSKMSSISEETKASLRSAYVRNKTELTRACRTIAEMEDEKTTEQLEKIEWRMSAETSSRMRQNRYPSFCENVLQKGDKAHVQQQQAS